MIYTQYIDESLGPVSVIGCSLHLVKSNFYPGPVTYWVLCGPWPRSWGGGAWVRGYAAPGLVHGEEEAGYEAMCPLASCMGRRSPGTRLCGPHS